jgi:FkbM family methyltransferase
LKNKEIYIKIKKAGIVITHACEVGVYLPETSNVIDFIEDGIRTTLVEPDPDVKNKIIKRFAGYPNVKLFPFAIYDNHGKITLSRAGASTFITNLENTPAIANDNYKKNNKDTFEAECRMFSEIDNGTIDLLSIDIEGAEWYVIKDMKSHPKVISVETHGRYYENPFLQDILERMNENGYTCWYKGKTDSVFVLDSLYKKNFMEKLHLFYKNLYIKYRKTREKN